MRSPRPASPANVKSELLRHPQPSYLSKAPRHERGLAEFPPIIPSAIPAASAMMFLSAPAS